VFSIASNMTTDHIELFVPDREAAVAWYAEWLGFERMPGHAAWAASGPIMLTNDRGQTMLALFRGEPLSGSQPKGWRRVAWRANAAEFAAFLRRFRVSGQKIEGPMDHQKAWSVYFSDPWGNLLEVTTYDYADVHSALAGP
jgi:catechol 2,3-dioxygenase-like lactoylglutathione lyase family enzyme